MSPIEAKLIEAWHDFKKYAESQMGYMNPQTLNERLNGAGAFHRLPAWATAEDGNKLRDRTELADRLMRGQLPRYTPMAPTLVREPF